MSRPIDPILSLLAGERGQSLATLREDQWFERKSARIQGKDLANALSGMANADGGALVIGITDGRIEGVRGAGDRLNQWRQAPVDHLVPALTVKFRPVAVINEGGIEDEVLVIEVPSSDRVHATRRDEVYLRIGDETRKLTFAQRQELEFDKGQSTFETTPARHVTYGDLDPGQLATFADVVGHPDPQRLLRARGLVVRDDAVSVGAALLFGEHPQAELPEAHVRLLRYRGTYPGSGRRQQVAHDQRIEGPLPEQILRARARITDVLPVRRALSPNGRFTDVGVVPTDAWLEGLVNAIVHRSYSMMGDHIRVEIFDDRVEIESPGRFPGIVDLSAPQDVVRFARNPRIARVLSDLGFGQELGEGIRRMFDEMRLAGLAEPHYEQTAGSVRLTLSADPVDRALEDRLSPRARDILRSIREGEHMSTGDLVAITGRSRPTLLRDLRLLEEAGLINWVGSSRKDPRAYWRLRRESHERH